MARFRKKPIIIEAITFDELVEYGKTIGRSSMVDGMPWSFDYNGYAITHENNDCYLVSTLEGTMHFERGAMLITGIKGEIYPCAGDLFKAMYEAFDHSMPINKDRS